MSEGVISGKIVDSTTLSSTFPNSVPREISAGRTPSNFSLIMPFSKDREQWLRTKAVDTRSGKRYSITGKEMLAIETDADTVVTATLQR